MLDLNIKETIRIVEVQLGMLEAKLIRAKNRINKIEEQLNDKIKDVRKQVKFVDNKTRNRITKIADALNDIENVVDKLNSVDIAPSGIGDISLESLIDDEYDRMELFVF